MTRCKEGQYSLQELAEQAGIPGRTLRYYIARGLVSGPDKAGRNAAYNAKHLAQIQRVRNLQAKGQTLSEIASASEEAPRLMMLKEEPAPYGESNVWRHYQIAPDVILMVRDPAAPWRIRKLINAVHRANLDDNPGNDQRNQEEYP